MADRKELCVVRFNSIEAPIVGENSIGMRLAWRSFQAVIRRAESIRRRNSRHSQPATEFLWPTLKRSKNQQQADALQPRVLKRP